MKAGVSILVDGFHVAGRLRREDPAAFALLSTLRQPFCGYGSVKFDWRAAGRVIALDHDDTVSGIRFAMASRAPLAIRDDLIEPYYRATEAMLRLVLDPECQLRLPLAAGDCLVLDNHRVLHGRTAMDPAAGRARRFRRFDVERDAAQIRMRQLARRLGRAVAPLPAGALASGRRLACRPNGLAATRSIALRIAHAVAGCIRRSRLSGLLLIATRMAYLRH